MVEAALMLAEALLTLAAEDILETGTAELLTT